MTRYRVHNLSESDVGLISSIRKEDGEVRKRATWLEVVVWIAGFIAIALLFGAVASGG